MCSLCRFWWPKTAILGKFGFGGSYTGPLLPMRVMRTVNNTLHALIDRACAQSATPCFLDSRFGAGLSIVDFDV